MLRADAGRTQGTGHVMRLLTLAEALLARGHRVTLATAEIEIPWLSAAVTASRVDVVGSPRDEIDIESLTALEPDWAVVDSYLVPADSVSALNDVVPVLLLADGDARGARASLYLDQNLGAPPLAGVDAQAQLIGGEFALVRRAIREVAHVEPAEIKHRPPEVVVVLGGTDPDDRTVEVARACVALIGRAAFTFVAPVRQRQRLDVLGGESALWRILPPTPDLPALLSEADVTISAGGTSAWDIATIGTPSLLLATVPNQQASLAAAVSAKIALGFDVVNSPPDADGIVRAVVSLIDDEALRRRLVSACRDLFDGRGAERVAIALEERSRRRRADVDA